MIGGTRGSWAWAQAALLSVSLHGAAAATLIYRPNWNFTPPPAPEEMRLEVTTLNPAGNTVQTQTLTPVSTPETSAARIEPELARQPEQEDVLARLENEAAAPVLSDTSLPMVQVPDAEPEPGQDGEDQSQPAAVDTAAADTDPRLVELFDRIRNLLTQPCLLALPALRGDNQIQLGVLAANDREISQLMDRLTDGLATQVTEAAVLLDQRQCPGLAFARRDPRYPVLGLGIQLESQDVSSGASLQGQISGGTGWYNTLLLVDDNGVVHDLRRFLIRSADRIRFEVPIARSGAARDTHQLVVAIATPNRPETVSRLSGETAERFFDALIREVGQEAMIGVSSIYVR
ncbi:hypothetical protein [Paracoccus onubensis]|uniref:Uncharacterized protein n=1 Tax=Paracoccus onubensis TaxID=1675788 RepID=A0A418T3V1_9RHOB|nr:hypothetical protein [Paracoccus onubensis]RJE87899.1 hypothetical protein D3P04_02960 [Paracoccus onubensis]